MTNDQFNILRTEITNDVRKFIIENGTIDPHLSILADKKVIKSEDDLKQALIEIPIPENIMNNRKDEKYFIEQIFPEIVKDIRRKFTIKAVVWTAIDTIFNKEFVVIYIESLERKDVITYKIIRSGKVVNSNGELIDDIRLEESEIKNPKESFIKTNNFFDK